MNAPSFPALEEAASRSLEAIMPEEPVLPLSVEAYHALLKAGILKDGDPVELLEGFLVPKMGKGPRHETARRKLRRLLEKMISDEYFVDEQGSLTTATSEPEPDVFVIRGTVADFADRHAEPSEVPLIVEVSDASIRRDRHWKLRVYGRAGIRCYWVVNLVDNCIEVYSRRGRSSKADYGPPTVYQVGDEVPVVIDGKEVGQIAVAAILGTPQKGT